MASMNEYCLPGQVGAIFPLQMITNDRKQQVETNMVDSHNKTVHFITHT